jgi:uncharacterized protein YneF (UPF0154 family)
MIAIIIWASVALVAGLVGGFFIGIFTFRKQMEKMQSDPDMMSKMAQDPEMMKRVAKQMGLNQQQVNKVQQMMKSRSRKK